MKDLPENELLMRAQIGDSDAENELVRRKEPMHRGFAAKFARFGNEADVLQAARTGTMEAIRRYRPNGATFSSVAFGRSKARAFRAAATNVAIARGATLSLGLWPDRDRMDVENHRDSSPNPERAAETADLREQVLAVLHNSREIMPVDQCIIERRLLVDEEDRMTLTEVGARFGMSREGTREREIKLKTKVLPKLLAPLHDEISR
jgi:RNA polymerase sigma factor (sigma-70 family)